MERFLTNYKKLFLIVVTIIGIWVFCYWQNNGIVVSSYSYYNAKLPADFNGFKIVHISDLHNKMFGREQRKLLGSIEKLAPDIIVVTGDLIDRRKFNLAVAMSFIEGAVKIAPTYYVSGNHEAWSGQYPLIRESLLDSGVYVLDDTVGEIWQREGTIQILGLADPDFLTSSYLEGTDTSQTEKQLKKWAKDKSFKILLSHRPELFPLYCNNNIDLVFSGHAHGGQFRLPFIGGLVAPDQGLFPQYTQGSYQQEGTTMFVSRGLGNSIIPLRVFNRPEIVFVTLNGDRSR